MSAEALQRAMAVVSSLTKVAAMSSAHPCVQLLSCAGAWGEGVSQHTILLQSRSLILSPMTSVAEILQTNQGASLLLKPFPMQNAHRGQWSILSANR